MASGSPTGPLYPLGKITVAAPGTPILLSQNVSISTAFGTAASPTAVVATQLLLSTPATNTGFVYLIFKGNTAAANNGTGIIVAIPPGVLYTLASPQLSNIFYLGNYAVDADTAANSLIATAVIV
jgi:hypothetical protein